MNNTYNPVQPTPPIQTPPSQRIPENQPVNKLVTSHKINLPIIIGAVLIIVFIGIGSCLLGTRKNQVATQDNSTQPTLLITGSSANTLPTTSNPSQSPVISPFGSSRISFADSGSEIYLKHTITLKDNKVEFPNDKARTMTKVYSQDEYLEPKELTNTDTANYKWIDIVEEGIEDFAGSKSILVSDRLFSFKKVPDSNSFIFVVEWSRSAGQNQGSWSPYQFERVLFYYDRSQGEGKLNKIQSFSSYPNDTNAYTFPKIDTFSNDNGYVSLQLFECWNCGGHMPETLLLNIQTLKTKNIGKVTQFAWKQNGTYEYKDYVVIECEEPQPGECTQDPNTLPLKTGQF